MAEEWKEGDPTWKHPKVLPGIAERMGVPHAWVSGPNRAEVTGKVVGHHNGQMFISAESTGGGVTDSHAIDWPTSLNRDQFIGKNMTFTAEGDYGKHGSHSGWTVKGITDDRGKPYRPS